jgi:hypothetical protein
MTNKHGRQVPHNFKDRTGQTFGRLTVLRLGEFRKGQTMWVCRCECGTEAQVDARSLRSGRTVSCGCRMRETGALRATHGEARTGRLSPEFKVWASMKGRCENRNGQSYAYYGAQGVKVCERWQSFAAFLEDMGRRPTPLHTIDRIDNAKGYEPGNCRWATRRQQCENRSMTVWITINGVTRCLSEWARMAGVHRETIRQRLRRGVPPEMAILSTAK